MDAGFPTKTQVIIVGCGPVGATLALMLGQRGVQTLIIDKALDIFLAPRAIAFDFDALRILQSLGLGEEDFNQVRIPFVRMLSPIFGEFARINTAREIDTHPMQITFYQPDLERALRARLASSPSVTTKLGVELLEFQQRDAGVIARLRSADGTTEEVEAQYLVGADGASSIVRSMIGQDFKGKSFAEDWLIIDAKSAPQPIDHVEFICDPKRPTPHMIAPGGRQRWEFMLAKGETRHQMESDLEVGRLLAPWGGVGTMEIERRAVYRFHARAARTFQSGRVFLAGDAAHITPPFVGQGLVSGLRDAANLSWKLASVVNGADASILESYDSERRPHSKAMINVARLMGKLIMPRNQLAAFATHGLIKLMRGVPRLRGLLEEQGIRPTPRYKRGCFLKNGKRDLPKPGYLLPQIWLQDQSGTEHRSDEVLGKGFALVGFGVDPHSYLNPTSLRIMHDLGGAIIHISTENAKPASEHSFGCRTVRDFITSNSEAIALIRPDRFIMASAKPSDVNVMLAKAEQHIRRKA